MSSLAAARADNFYHPPDWDPRKKSRAEHAVGATSKADKWKAHPLRERAKKLASEGVLMEARAMRQRLHKKRKQEIASILEAV